jgi:hypothetical protein
MEVRFKLSFDVYVSGNDMKEIREKFDAMPLFSVEALDNGAEISELLLVEDAETYKNLMDEYNKV